MSKKTGLATVTLIVLSSIGINNFLPIMFLPPLTTARGIKNIIFHPKFLPSIVILDPILTLGLPPKITAATGMDALAHNLEAYCAPGYHPMADGIALEGMRLINEWLLEAVNNGSNIEARQNMLTAASMGSTAFQKGLGAIHSLSHPVNALNNVHHGLSNAIFMPYVLTFNKADLRVNGKKMELTSLPGNEWGKVVEDSKAFWDETSKISPRAKKVVDAFKLYAQTMDKAGYPYR